MASAIAASSSAKPGLLVPLRPHRAANREATSRFPRISAVVISPTIRTQSSPVEAILRPWRVCQVSSALLKIGIRGVTVSDARGFGAQGGSSERQGGSEFSEERFVAKVKMEIVVGKDQVEAVLEKIIEEGRAGEIGDGKIFLVPVADVLRVRTGRRDLNTDLSDITYADFQVRGERRLKR